MLNDKLKKYLNIDYERNKLDIQRKREEIKLKHFKAI